MKKKKEAAYGYFYIAPSLILILIFSIIPIFMNVYFSLTDYNILKAPVWVGIENFKKMFQDTFFHASLKNTLLFTVITVPIQTVFSILLASMLAEFFRNSFGSFSRSALFIPVIASAVLTGMIWPVLLNTRGPINLILSVFGIDPINWLGGHISSMVSVCITTIWKNVGYFMVIYYAGIMDIPRSYYEAAEVDGANAVQRFLKITLPGLSDITYLVVIMGTIWSCQVFDIVYTMTNGGPGTSTTTLVLTVYKAAFKEYRMGYASALSLVLFAIVLIISIIQKRILNKQEDFYE